jgi:hypothetical protein
LKVNAWPIGLMAPAVAIDAAMATVSDATISGAMTVPAETLSAMITALVEARTIPAIDVEANRDVLDRSKCFDWQIATHRRAQRRRLDTVLDESPCRQDRRCRCKSQKKSMHNIDPPWIEPSELDESQINVPRAQVVPRVN